MSGVTGSTSVNGTASASGAAVPATAPPVDIGFHEVAQSIDQYLQGLVIEDGRLTAFCTSIDTLAEMSMLQFNDTQAAAAEAVLAAELPAAGNLPEPITIDNFQPLDPLGNIDGEGEDDDNVEGAISLESVAPMLSNILLDGTIQLEPAFQSEPVFQLINQMCQDCDLEEIDRGIAETEQAIAEAVRRFAVSPSRVDQFIATTAAARVNNSAPSTIMSLTLTRGGVVHLGAAVRVIS